jgi:hypothetical protein
LFYFPHSFALHVRKSLQLAYIFVEATADRDRPFLPNPNELAFPFAGSLLNNLLLSFVHLPCIHLKSSLGRGHLRTASGSAFSLPSRKYADALPNLNTELHKWTLISK